MKARLEHIQADAGSSFARLRFSGAAFICPYHTHPEVEILVIDSGAGRCMIGDALSSFSAGDMFVFGPHVPHLFVSHPGSSSLAESRYIQFRQDRLGAEFWRTPELAGVVRLLERSSRGLRLTPSAARRVRSAFDTAHGVKGGRALVALLGLLLELAEVRPVVCSELAFCEPHRDADRLGRAIDMIHARFHENLALGQVARRAGLSASAFSRFFHRRTGKTFQAHLLDIRLGEVKRRLLLDSELTVAEAAFACGFNNLSNFNRLFLRENGQSPRAWRRCQMESAVLENSSSAAV